jgi:uncharacterized protein (TIGR02453 family)
LPIKPELFTFLRELKNNNNRDWFQANKSRYENEVKRPLFDFIEDFGGRLPAISPHYQAIPSTSGGSLFRIYRDVRFSKDKSPYKTGAGIHFRHERARDVHAPGFYLHLEPGDVFAACGIWHPDPAALGRIREVILEHPERWLAARDESGFRSAYALEGDSLARPPRGIDPEHPLVEDLKRKDFLGSAELSEDLACRPDFLDRYFELCLKAVPFMRFLTEALDLSW